MYPRWRESGRDPKWDLSLVLTSSSVNCDMSKILINEEIYWDIMYVKLIEQTRLIKKKLWSYEWSYLQAFNGTVTRPWGRIELIPVLDDGKDTRTVNR